jgi:PAS domain-containing protein
MLFYCIVRQGEVQPLATGVLGGEYLWAGISDRLAPASGASDDFANQALGTVRNLIEELNNREAHLQAILATVPDAMVVIDERGIIQSFSATAERLFGLRPTKSRAVTSVC